MHFGPEWMRTKHQPAARPQRPPSPTPNNLPIATGASTYSALVSPAAPPQPDQPDETHPFRYSREEMLRIYKECQGRGVLGIEVERWEGVVRDIATDPVACKEMDEAEKKLFAAPLNSEIRRRQSTTDHPTFLSTTTTGLERPRLGHSNTTAAASPHRDRFGVLMGRRRDSDAPSLTIPGRKVSGALPSPRDGGLVSPRSRSGFDGVLSGSGEGWLARRKASESKQLDPGDASAEKKPSGAEDSTARTDEGGLKPNGNHSSSTTEHGSSISDTSQMTQAEDHGLSNGVRDLSLQETNGTSAISAVEGGSSSTSAQDSVDLASVEWSYLDPQGQVQGPFRADTMQKWYDDGYFTPDLPTKRTQSDANWIRVDELVIKARGGKPFLSPPESPPPPPPGLMRHAGAPLNSIGIPLANNSFSQPFQPAPLANLRTSTLDSFLTNGAGFAESPSSAFSAGRFGNNSPDAIGGRTSSRGSYTMGDPSVGVRPVGYATVPESSVTYPPVRRELYDIDPTYGVRSQQPYGNTAPGRPADMYGFNGGYQPNQWSTSITDPSIANGYEVYGVRAGPEMSLPASYSAPGGIPGSSQPSIMHMHPPPQENGFNNMNPNVPFGNTNFASPAVPPVDSNGVSYTGHLPPIPSQIPISTPPSATDNIPVPVQPTEPSNESAVAPAPWKKPADSTPRPSPFDALHPKATNTAPAAPVPVSQPSAWKRNPPPSQSNQSNSHVNDPSPWFAASHVAEDDAWKEPTGPNSLTFSNIVQHNNQQQQLAAENNTPSVTQTAQPPVATPKPSIPAETPAAPAAAVAPIGNAKSRRKSTSQQAQKPAAAPAAPVPSLPTKSPSPPPSTLSAGAKQPAWATEEDSKKSKPSSVSLSLREIQEAEAKKAEARKAAEREKERAARAIAVVDEAQPFSASWGLPTSQTGARSNLLGKEVLAGAAASSSAPTTPPVWTTAVKPPSTKKTMKEIQDEEERRKKLAVKETAAAALKRGYAESTTKATSPAQPPAQASNAWSVVGPSGKAVPGAAPARPPITPAASHAPAAPAPTPRPNGITTTRPSAASVAKAASKIDDYPVNPSHDFLKWLSDSLKGLSSTVNVEEIMQMLLSFPLDPDPSTTEIISDLIYAHSTTLDGRRFSAEFISKRKADVASRPKTNVNGNAMSKPVSIADVVKAQPKPTQPEWGGFKVVNKKKKGGRA
ncbi:hypothetical protein CCMSSC00406_0000156 [Pleurotus cornucopiae]|uniref:Uncharacterized protein n=1 Tax=Pleurotus cornucopiae TaxID=5321 RepID=A0ACB7IZG4_PLECO|nr:hypothetical protein CCMSSC00406_0000156 [Pleurotus cornucopiae]